MPLTFLFTDIEGSTRLWQEHPEAMGAVLARHDEVIAEAVAGAGGRVFKHTGDGVAAVFADPSDAVGVAARIQQRFQAAAHDSVGPLSIRIGLHCGEAEERDGDFFGLTVSRTARLMDAAHGGQVLVSSTVAGLIGEKGLVDLGEFRLKDLASPDRVYQLVVDGVAAEFPHLRTLDATPNNLPVLTTSFVGRHQEHAELTELVRGSRLVTVSGVGGAGKTRLALQVAADLVPEFPDGVWIVELATVTDPEMLDAAVVSALGIPQPAGTPPRQAVADHLGQRGPLLIIDNCEHVVDAAAETVAHLLSVSPATRVIATSRELLGVAGEVSYRLRSLGMPHRGEQELAAVQASDAVRLFSERAAAARPGFHISSENAASVVEICQRLDGMPLALELAAARLRSFSVSEIAQHLDQRFRLLTGGSRTALPRQQTLTAAIEWSYRLLSEAEKALFRRLSVFSGTFTYAAVEEVCTGDPVERDDVLEVLPALVDKSLVVAEELDGVVRYRLLETLRQFARDRLDEAGDAEMWRRRHAEHYAGLAGIEHRRRLLGPDGPAERLVLRTEMANLRQGLAWSVGNGERDLALALLYPFSRMSLRDRRWSEALAWSEEVAGLVDEGTAPHLRAEWLTGYGSVLYNMGESERAIELLSEAVEVFRRLSSCGADDEELHDFPRALNNLGLALLYTGQAGDRNERYTELEEEVLAIARRLEDEFFEAMALANLAHHRDPGGDSTQARRLFEEAEDAARKLGPDRLAGLAEQRAFFEFDQGEVADAVEHLTRAVALAEETGDLTSSSTSRVALAAWEFELGDESAVSRFGEAVAALFADHELAAGLIFHQLTLALGAGIDAGLQRFERVAVAAGASRRLAERDLPLRWDVVSHFDRVVEAARQALGDHAFDQACERGAAFTDDELTAFLLEPRT